MRECMVGLSETALHFVSDTKEIQWVDTDATHDEGSAVDLTWSFEAQGWRGARRRSAPAVVPGAGCGPARGDPNRP